MKTFVLYLVTIVVLAAVLPQLCLLFFFVGGIYFLARGAKAFDDENQD